MQDIRPVSSDPAAAFGPDAMSAVDGSWLAQDATLRRASRDDVDRMARTFVRSQERVGSLADRHGITVDKVSQWMLKALLHDELWLLEREYGEIAGVLALSGDDLDVLDVEPQLRGRGYGTRLLEVAKRRRPGGLVARISARRTEARSFLLQHGFAFAGSAGPEGLETFVWGPRSARWQRRGSSPLSA